MYLLLLFILLMIIILFQEYNIPNDDNNEDGNIEPFWYYPNCMETVFGGMRCYPYYYYPYRRYYYPLYPWSYYW
jgi:hypothetical protein